LYEDADAAQVEVESPSPLLVDAMHACGSRVKVRQEKAAAAKKGRGLLLRREAGVLRGLVLVVMVDDLLKSSAYVLYCCN
jgi:hypothetical protein